MMPNGCVTAGWFLGTYSTQVGVQVAAKSNQRRGAIKGTKKASLCFSPQLGQKARSGGVFFSRRGGREQLHVTRQGDCKRAERDPADWRSLYGELRMATG